VAKASGVSLGTDVTSHSTDTTPLNPTIKAQSEDHPTLDTGRMRLAQASVENQPCHRVMAMDFTVPGFVNFVKSVQEFSYHAGYVF